MAVRFRWHFSRSRALIVEREISSCHLLHSASPSIEL